MSKSFDLDTKAFRTEVLQAPWMLEYVTKVAKERARTDAHVKPFIGFDRAHAIVYPNTRKHPS